MPMLFVQRIGSSNITPLSGTQGASYPFWSPDNAFIGFFANGKLQKIAVTGGPPQALATAHEGRGGSWGSKNVIIFSPDAQSPIMRVSPDGGAATAVTDKIQVSGDASHRFPIFLPDGNHFLFWAGNFSNVKEDQSSGIVFSSLEGKQRKFIVPGHSSFAVDANNLYYVDGSSHLVALKFNQSNGDVSGTPSVIATTVGFQASTFWAALTASQTGTLIYNASSGAMQSVLTWFDRSGKDLGKVGQPAVICNPSISPMGNRVAVDVSDPKANNVDVWIESVTDNQNSRFTFDPAEEVAPVWSRDGSQITYRLADTDGASIMLKSASGLEREKRLFTTPSTSMDDLVANSWTLDGTQILITRKSSRGDHLLLLPIGGGEPKPLFNTDASTTAGQISPDGKWIVYASDETGNWEIYVSSFPGAQGKWQVSRGGGTEPRWRGDGKEIFYIAPNGMLNAVGVNGESTFATGTPMPLFEVRGRAAISSTDVYSYDVAKDGKRFLVNSYMKPEHIAPLSIVLNAGTPPESVK
jgi:Tol biopolymer transport system component